MGEGTGKEGDGLGILGGRTAGRRELLDGASAERRECQGAPGGVGNAIKLGLGNLRMLMHRHSRLVPPIIGDPVQLQQVVLNLLLKRSLP